jgi:hypothetical protein
MRNFGWSIFTFFVPLCSGCSGYDNPLFSSGLSPGVEDRALIQQAISAKDVSGGKDTDHRMANTLVPGSGNLAVMPPALVKGNS